MVLTLKLSGCVTGVDGPRTSLPSPISCKEPAQIASRTVRDGAFMRISKIMFLWTNKLGTGLLSVFLAQQHCGILTCSENALDYAL